MTREERRRVAILQIFAEAQRKGRSPRLNFDRADVRRARHRATVLDQELDLRASLRVGVSMRSCYLCGARVEWRRGRRNLLEHRCVGGAVRAPLWPRVDLRIDRMLAAEVPVATIALRLGLSRTAVYKNSEPKRTAQVRENAT